MNKSKPLAVVALLLMLPFGAICDPIDNTEQEKEQQEQEELRQLELQQQEMMQLLIAPGGTKQPPP